MISTPSFRFHASLPYVICLVVVVILGMYSLTPRVNAASYTWNGAGTDGTCGGHAGDGNKWSCAANWSSGVVPTATDNATFNNTSSKIAVVDSAFAGSITNLTIASTYTGTVSLGRNLTVTGVFSQAGGSFNANANDLSVASNFTMSGGSFTAPSTNLTLNSTVSITGGAFNHNNGLVIISGNATNVISCNNVVFNRVLPQWTSGTKTISSNCTLPLGANPVIPGQMVLVGALSGTGTVEFSSAGNSQFSAGSSLPGFTGLIVQASLNIFNNFNASAYTTFDINGGFGINNTAVFTAPAQMNIAANFTISSGGIFNHNNGTVIFDGVTAGTINCDNAIFYKVMFAHTAGIKTVSTNCNLPLGANPTLGYSVSSGGTLSGTGTLTAANALTLNNSAGGLSGFTGIVVGGSFSTGGTAVTDLSNYTIADFNTNFTLSGGTFTAPSGDMSVALSFTISGGTFTHNNGRIVFDGAANGTLSCNNTLFHLVSLAHTGGTINVGANCQLPLGNNPETSTILSIGGTLSGTGTWSNSSSFVLNQGSSVQGFSGIAIPKTTTTMTINTNLDASTMSLIDIDGNVILGATGRLKAPSQLTIGGSLTISPGATFDANNGTVTIDGASNGTLSCSNAVFYRVVLAHVAGSRTINSDCSLPLGDSPSVMGIVILNGTLSGTGTLQTYNNMTINAGGIWQGFGGYRQEMGIFTLNGGTFDVSGYSPFFLHSYFIQNDGTFIAPPVMEVVSRFQISGGTFVHNNGTVVFDRYEGGSSTIAIQCIGNPFHLVSFARFSYAPTAYQISPGCTVPLGQDPYLAAPGTGTTFTVQGKLEFSGMLHVSANLVLDSPDPLSGGQSIEAEGNVTVQSGQVDLSSYRLIKAGSFDINDGTFVAPARLEVGSFNRIGGTFEPGQGTLAFTGSSPVLNSKNSDLTLTNIEYAPSASGQLTVSTGQNLYVQGLFKLDNGPIELRSDTPGQQAVLDLAGPRAVSHTTFKDIHNSNSTPLAAAENDNYDGGNNTGIDFSKPAISFARPLPTEQVRVSSDRPTFTWAVASSESLSPIVSYSLSVANKAGTVFAVEDIPPSGPSSSPLYDLQTSDTTIQLTTKSSDQWPDNYNDGRLKTGPQTWTVTAMDEAGNTHSMTAELVFGGTTTGSNQNSNSLLPNPSEVITQPEESRNDNQPPTGSTSEPKHTNSPSKNTTRTANTAFAVGILVLIGAVLAACGGMLLLRRRAKNNTTT